MGGRSSKKAGVHYFFQIPELQSSFASSAPSLQNEKVFYCIFSKTHSTFVFQTQWTVFWFTGDFFPETIKAWNAGKTKRSVWVIDLKRISDYTRLGLYFRQSKEMIILLGVWGAERQHTAQRRATFILWEAQSDFHTTC